MITCIKQTSSIQVKQQQKQRCRFDSNAQRLPQKQQSGRGNMWRRVELWDLGAGVGEGGGIVKT